MAKIFTYQYIQISHAAQEMLLVITLVLIFCAYRNKTLSSCWPSTPLKAAFPLVLLCSIILPLYFNSVFLTTTIIPTAVFVAWLFVIAPLWNLTSHSGRNIAGILSFPGTFLIGGWPVTLMPGIVALPFGWWRPAPFSTIKMNAIGNIKGYESSLVLDSVSLIFWVTLLAGLAIFGCLSKRADKTCQTDSE